MKILPSWREKKRYLVIQTEHGIEDWPKIRDNFIKFAGMLQAAKAGARLIKSVHLMIIISISRNYVDLFRASLTSLNIQAHCIYVSGTLKKVKEKEENQKRLLKD